MSKTLLRDYGFSLVALVLCTGALLFVLIVGNRAISKIDNQVVHTYNVINNAQGLSAFIEGMVASQRGFLVTQDHKFLEKYHERRDKVSGLIANLSELIRDNESQVSRVDELRHHFNEFSVKLEQRAEKFTLTSSSRIILENLEEIDGLKENILRINTDILREEYGLLNGRIKEIEQQKIKYFRILMAGIAAGSLLLILFNNFFFYMQRKRNIIEADLKDTQERFALAIEGTQDGIFDWNIKTGEVFYSKQFFGILGYDRGAYMGDRKELSLLLHPEDAEKVSAYDELYLQGRFSEYSQEFRLRHKNNRWVWIQARAKAIFDEHGRAVRLVESHTDITYMKEHQARLESEKKAAEDANRAKSDFLAHMSHEIRTPLTAISGIAEIFQNRQEHLDDKQKKLLKTLHSSTTALKDLINDILDFSKIESGELELEKSHFKIRTLFEDIISMMGVRAQEKRIKFVFDYSAVKELIFFGDKTRLRQIIVNLIGNAIKFTQEGSVTVRAYTRKKEEITFMHIDVTDTGIGIAPENFDLIFERFKQADPSVSRKYGGTGLGLAISRNLAKLMDGDITLKSDLGKGSSFCVSINFWRPW
ncbi:MAG: PAS domain-containing protein [Alphaproteobacteria bacterium]|nr:PAS domain-containing protein [Alphaproteobacteria bacterium]